MKYDKKEVGISIVRSAFSAIPYAGQLLNEVAFEYRGRIKQNRLNKFTELLSEFFMNDQDIELGNLKTEDFSDLLESVLQRVVKTKSDQKHKRLRDVLISKIKNPLVDIDNSEVYLDLITSLNEDEIKILYHHQVFDKSFDNDKNTLDKLEHDLISKKEKLRVEEKTKNKGLVNDFEKVSIEVTGFENVVDLQRQKLKSLQKFREHNFYGLTIDRFLYYKQSLYSKGLLIDNGIGAIGVRPFQVMSITEFGKEFINFIIQT